MLCFEVLRDRNILVVRSEGPPEQADFDSSPDMWSSRAEETRNEGTLVSVKAAGLLVRRASVCRHEPGTFTDCLLATQ